MTTRRALILSDISMGLISVFSFVAGRFDGPWIYLVLLVPAVAYSAWLRLNYVRAAAEAARSKAIGDVG